MTREEYGKLAVADLRERAKERGIKGVSSMRKMDLIQALLGEKSAESSEGKRPDRYSAGKESGEAARPAQERAHGEAAQPAQERAHGEAAQPAQERAHGEAARPAQERAHGETVQSAQGRAYGEAARPAQGRAHGEEENQAAPRMARRQITPRPDGRARVIVRRPQGSGQPSQGRSTSADGSEIRVLRPSAPMTRGEMYQSNPQPRQESPENLADRADQDRPPMELKQLDSGNEVSGVLEVMADGYGFIRSDNYLPGEDDVYVSPSQIRKFGLKTGDIVCGNTRVHAQQEKFSALLFVKLINGYTPSEAAKRYDFESMTPIFPNERLRMERTGREVAMRIVDLLAPIGKGQRGLIVSPPKAGKTTLLKDIARSILRNNPEMHIIIMLIDERPEEVTDIREAIVGDNVEVLDSTFDETPEHHKRVAEMGIERARRLVEHKRDVVILLDSITRLARAYNLIVPPSGRTLSGGLDPAALHPPKRFFGAARNMREGGSLTILATALVDTGSKMDDVVYEEFKGTGNMELILDRKLSERRVFPAIDIQKSGTRREDLLLTPDEGEASYVMRRAMNGMKGEDAVERILDMFSRTRNNEELIQRVKHSHVV